MAQSTAHIAFLLATGRLALKLLEKNKTILYKSQVFAVYTTISWLNTPFQSIIDFHNIGYKAGIAVGDAFPSILNASLALSTSYVAGRSLNDARKKCRELTLKVLRDKAGFIADNLSLLVSKCCRLQ